jgi:hypothetical protein
MSLSRLAVSLGILISIGLRVLLPVLDRYAVEQDPWHMHIVIGASSSRQYTQALARHHHGSQPLQPADYPTGSKGGTRVYSISSQLDTQATAFGVELQNGFVLGSLPVVDPPAGIWQTDRPATVSPAAVDLPQLTPPPRFFP